MDRRDFMKMSGIGLGALMLPIYGRSVAADVLPDDHCGLCAGLELVGGVSVWAVDVATARSSAS